MTFPIRTDPVPDAAAFAPPSAPRAMPVQVLEGGKGHGIRRLLARLRSGGRRILTG